MAAPASADLAIFINRTTHLFYLFWQAEREHAKSQCGVCVSSILKARVKLWPNELCRRGERGHFELIVTK